MVKGTSRRVIVVDSPDPELFEQAIFVIRKDVACKSDITQERLVREACQVARGYCGSHGRRMKKRYARTPLFWSAIGAGGVAIGWLVTALANI